MTKSHFAFIHSKMIHFSSYKDRWQAPEWVSPIKTPFFFGGLLCYTQ